MFKINVNASLFTPRAEYTNEAGIKVGEAIETPSGILVWGRDLGYDDDTNLTYLGTADDFDGAGKLIRDNEPPETIEFVTPNKTWNVPLEALREIASDLINTAIGGTNYWAFVSKHRWGSPAKGHGDGRPWSDTDVTYANVTIHETESHDDGPAKVKDVDVEQMVEVMRKVVAGEAKPFYNPTGYSTTYRERLIAVLDQLDRGMLLEYADYGYDADDADCMMQIAVLGEIIYG